MNIKHFLYERPPFSGQEVTPFPRPARPAKGIAKISVPPFVTPDCRWVCALATHLLLLILKHALESATIQTFPFDETRKV
jgi:hypothetical protein